MIYIFKTVGEVILATAKYFYLLAFFSSRSFCLLQPHIFLFEPEIIYKMKRFYFCPAQSLCHNHHFSIVWSKDGGKDIITIAS